MNLSDKYRPRRLAEIVGQPQIYKLMALAARPRRFCWLLEGQPGTGKSATAHALSEELGCSIFSKHPMKASDLNKDTAEQLFNHTVRCVPTLDAIRPTLQVMGEEHNRQLTALKVKVARVTTASKGPGKKTRRPIAAKRQRRANSKPRRATSRATSKS